MEVIHNLNHMKLLYTTTYFLQVQLEKGKTENVWLNENEIVKEQLDLFWDDKMN